MAAPYCCEQVFSLQSSFRFSFDTEYSLQEVADLDATQIQSSALLSALTIYRLRLELAQQVDLTLSLFPCI